MIQDKNISRKYRRDFYTPQMLNLSYTAHDDGVNQELNSGQGTIDKRGNFSMAGFGSGNTFHTLMPLPIHWDHGEEIGIRFIWGSSGGSAGETCDWATGFQQFALGAAVGSYALLSTSGTAVAVDPSAGNDKLNASTWGRLNADTLNAEDNDFLAFEVTVTTSGSMVVDLYGIEICYLPAITTGEKQAKGDFPEDA